MTHPFASLLSEARIARLWAGLALSRIGVELHGIAVLWLAIGIAGPQASLLPMAQSAVILLVSLGAGLFADRVAPRAMMIGTDLLSALAALLPVVLAATQGLTLSTLFASAIGLAALGALFQPALLSTIPEVARTRERIQGLNALLDATTRLSRLAGPFIAGLLNAVLPVIHFLSLTAVGFLASAAAIATMGRGAGAASPNPAPAVPRMSMTDRLMQGWRLATADRDTRVILCANTLVLAAWTLGVSLGLPFLVAQSGVSGLGLAGLGALAALVAAYGAGDFLSNVWVAGQRPRRVGRFMFGGYVILGGALALVPLPLALLPPSGLVLPVMMGAAFVAGLGGPLFFIPMMTLLQTRLGGSELSSVIRLRMALIALGMMAGAALGPLVFGRLGAAVSVSGAGLLIAAVGAWGSLRHADLGREPVSEIRL